MRPSSAQGDLIYTIGVSRGLQKRKAALDAEREVVGVLLYNLSYLRTVQFPGLPVDDLLGFLVIETEFLLQ